MSLFLVTEVLPFHLSCVVTSMDRRPASSSAAEGNAAMLNIYETKIVSTLNIHVRSCHDKCALVRYPNPWTVRAYEQS